MQINVNIIGMGIMGNSVTRVLQRNPNVKLTAVANRGKEKLDEALKEFDGLNTYTEYREMLDREKPDAVFIATPDWAHFDPVIESLNRGVHVLVEKPLTTDVTEATRIVEKVKETGLKLQVSYNHRWLSPYYATWEKIHAGEIGRCLMGYARKNNPITVPTKMLPDWAKDSSPMWFQSSHDIDLVNWWLNDEAVEATCYGVKEVLKDRFGWDTWDALQGLVRYKRGGIFTFEAAWIYPEKHPAMPDSFISLVGEQGHIHLDRKSEAIEMSSPSGLSWPRSFLNYKVFENWTGAFPACINSFVDAILEDREPHVNAMDGWRATSILDALHRSAQSGKTVDIPTTPVL